MSVAFGREVSFSWEWGQGRATGDLVSLSHLFLGPELAAAGRWHLSPKTVVFLAGYLVLTLLWPSHRHPGAPVVTKDGVLNLGGLVT